MTKKMMMGAMLLSMALFAHAQEKVLTLQQCIDMAMKQNYSVQASEKSIERAKAMQGTAWDVDKTEISFGQDLTSGVSTDNAIIVSQGMEFPTYYIAMRKQLKAETQAEKSKHLVLLSALAAEVMSTYYQLVYEKQRVQLLAQQDSVLTLYKQLADKRYQAGETHRLEVASVEKMLRENGLEKQMALSETEGVRMQLAKLLNDASVEPADHQILPIDMKPADFNYLQTPEGQYANDRLEIANKAVTVAKNGYAPSLSVSLKNQLVLSGWNPYHVDRSKFSEGNFLGFEVGVGVPLFFGATKAKVKAAKKDREIAELEMKEEKQQREKEYLAALSKCNSTFVRMNYYQQEGDKKAEELSRLGGLEYQTGGISYHEYIEALQESIDVKMKHIEAINDYNQAVIVLKKLTNTL